jgi:hypothetical protein
MSVYELQATYQREMIGTNALDSSELLLQLG